MTNDEHRIDIETLLDDADSAYFSDAKQHLTLTAIARSLMWIAEELHELNERSKDGRR